MPVSALIPPSVRAVLLPALLALAPALAAQEPAPGGAEPPARRIAWHWQTGKRYVLHTDTETVLDIKPLGGQGEQILQVAQTTDVTVRPGANPDTKELKVRFLTMQARMAVNDKVFYYDSEEPSDSDPALRELLADSSGRGFSLIYSADDRFVELGQVDQPAALPGTEPSLLAVADARQVAELYRRSLEMALPRPEVIPGDKWVSIEQMKFPQSGEMEVKMNCHFAEIVEREGRPHAKVTFQGSLDPKPVQTPEADGRAVRFGDKSTISGHIFFDLERRVISLSMFLGSIILNHEGQNLPVRQSVTTRLESLEDAPAP